MYFSFFQTEEVVQKDGCGSQTQLRGVALGTEDAYEQFTIQKSLRQSQSGCR